MVYVVIKTFDFEGRTYFPGQLIKLDKEQLKAHKDKVAKQVKATKDLLGHRYGKLSHTG